MGFLGVAGIAIIALYVYAQGRRSRAKDTGEAEPAGDPGALTTQAAETSRVAQSTGTDGK